MADPAPSLSPLAQAAQTILDAKAQIAKVEGTPAPKAEEFNVDTDGDGVMDAVKPGYKTSEFWLTAIHSICALLASSGAIPGFVDPTAKATSLATAGISLALYIFSRIKAKA